MVATFMSDNEAEGLAAFGIEQITPPLELPI